MVQLGSFREDLYYRLHVIPIQLPSLRECGNDIMQIAEKYLQEYAEEEQKNFREFSPQAAEILKRYQWPGNVRQLQNVIRNIVVLQNGDVVTEVFVTGPDAFGVISVTRRGTDNLSRADPSESWRRSTDSTIVAG